MMDEKHLTNSDNVTLSFSKAASFILFSYFCLRVIDMLSHGNFHYLFSGYGLWWLIEMGFFVLTPCLLYAKGSREENVGLCQFASCIAVAGIIVNRFTICMIAFNYDLPSSDRYFPSLPEIMVSVFVVTMIVTCPPISAMISASPRNSAITTPKVGHVTPRKRKCTGRSRKYTRNRAPTAGKIA